LFGISVGTDGEGTSGRGLPHVLLIIVVLRGDGHLVGHQVGGVETHTELSNHGNIGTGLQGLHESLGSRLGDGSQVVDQVGLGHTDTGIDDGQCAGRLVGDKLDVELLAGVQLAGIRQGLVADLVQSIGGVRDQLSQEDLLVRVECVDDQGHQLSDLSLEGEGLCFLRHLEGIRSIGWISLSRWVKI